VALTVVAAVGAGTNAAVWFGEEQARAELGTCNSPRGTTDVAVAGTTVRTEEIRLERGVDFWARMAPQPLEVGPSGYVEYQGVMHPGLTASYALQELVAGRQATAEGAAGALMASAPDGRLAYRFDWKSGAWTMKAPWYSAFSQGLALSLFSRLWTATGDHRYRDYAALLEASLRPGAGVSRTDAAGYLWFEGFPTDELNPILDDHTFATFGLYDYWQATGDAEAEVLARAGFVSLRDHIRDWRRAGAAPGYDLLRWVPHAPPEYDAIYGTELAAAYDVTGDGCLDTARQAFARDFASEAGRGGPAGTSSPD